MGVAAVLGLSVVTLVAYFRLAASDALDDETAAWIDLPSNYQTLSSTEKAALLWSKVEQSKYSSEDMPTWENGSGGLFQLITTGMVDVAPSFTCNVDNSDIMPVGRARGIHNLGVVGRIQWTMSNNSTRNNFTGLLANGASTAGIIRLSLSRPPAPDGDFMPGFGIKLLVDGRPSVNTVANVDLNGQTNMNFFGDVFRTSLPKATQFSKKIVGVLFERVEAPANRLPVRDLARLDQQGTLVENPVYPFLLEFRPHERVADLIANNTKQEARAELQEKLSPGPLLHVYAAGFYADPDAFKIGEISLTTGVLASSFGDKKLCYKHQRHTPRKGEEL